MEDANYNQLEFRFIEFSVTTAGAEHNVVNTSKESELNLYTIYSPPEHQDKVVRHTKADAETSTEEYDGKPTE